MQFVTRFHYWAADTITYGSNTTWGEHEIDYILFLKLKENKAINIRPNTEEVSAYRFVSIEGGIARNVAQ
jgi:isopentenyl-diphosphate delta-isomerase